MEAAVVLALEYGLKYGPKAFSIVKSIITAGADIPKDKLLQLLTDLENELVSGETLIPKRTTTT